MALTGGCLCGAVRYECAMEPMFSGNCHCKSCQKMTGTAFSAVFFVPEPMVKIQGEVKYYAKLGDDGLTSYNGFCPNCGSPLFGKPGKVPGMIGVRAGSLDDPNQFKPQMDIFTSRATHWDVMDPNLPKFAEYPAKPG